MKILKIILFLLIATFSIHCFAEEIRIFTHKNGERGGYPQLKKGKKYFLITLEGKYIKEERRSPDLLVKLYDNPKLKSDPIFEINKKGVFKVSNDEEICYWTEKFGDRSTLKTGWRKIDQYLPLSCVIHCKDGFPMVSGYTWNGPINQFIEGEIYDKEKSIKSRSIWNSIG